MAEQGRRADDIKTVVVKSGRRESDVVKTFGLIGEETATPSKKSSWSWVAWLFAFMSVSIFACIVIAFMSMCYWMTVIFD